MEGEPNTEKDPKASIKGKRFINQKTGEAFVVFSFTEEDIILKSQKRGASLTTYRNFTDFVSGLGREGGEWKEEEKSKIE